MKATFKNYPVPVGYPVPAGIARPNKGHIFLAKQALFASTLRIKALHGK